ncbi:hypothetical protein [Bradyrhizobium sp. ISRA464]|uniref:hypothetical protein n=1 Tax=Bradyrhizobium sp. ISRA464 TaxID=2866200 RepID=UPI0024791C53|nr:hypothetical protein [Bradyrhizobium sp. ISRA464]WGS27064.1 hypothetical protein MTX19_36370 [Bradyrhizobium sp. ISRA464]
MIRPAHPGDATFIARIILASQRGPLPRDWCGIALDLAAYTTVVPAKAGTHTPWPAL